MSNPNEYDDDGLEAAERRMNDACERYRQNTQQSLVIGCLVPIILGIILVGLIAAQHAAQHH